MKKIIENVKFIQDGTLVFGDLHLENGFVERIDYKTPHANSYLAIPGFIDLHTHGFRGHDCDNIQPENLKQLALEYAKRGITAFCPTISARSLAEYAAIIEGYHAVFENDIKGAAYCGIHMEGPFLNPDCCGAQEKNQLCEINLSELDGFLSNYHDDICIMTISPDIPNAMEAISLLHLYGVQVSLGHTNASFDTTMEAFENGATRITHLCNTMPFIDHHTETMMDAVFLSDCCCEIIMDRKHIQHKMLKWLIPLLGCKRINAISDGRKQCGYEKGEEGYSDTSCDMLDIFRFLYREEMFDLADCLQMCSGNAAKMLKSYSYEIGLGKKIDLVVLDHDLRICEVIINGKSILHV